MLRKLPSVSVAGEVVPLNAGDVERVLAYWTEAATVKLVGFPKEMRDSYSGKKELRQWFRCLVEQRLQVKIKVVKVRGNVVSTRTETTRRDLSGQIGSVAMMTMESYIVEEGKIAGLTVTIPPLSLPALQSFLHVRYHEGGDTR